MGALAPHTEADPVALLADFLVSFGNAIGAGLRFMVGGTAHYPRENVCLVGRTSKARKGTARAEIRAVMEYADPRWCETRVVGGISSGEGLIAAVRDACGDDQGETDKRLLAVESEFARVLVLPELGSGTLTTRLQAWSYVAATAERQPKAIRIISGTGLTTPAL